MVGGRLIAQRQEEVGGEGEGGRAEEERTLTTNPTKPMTTKPKEMALRILKYSAQTSGRARQGEHEGGGG